MIRGYNTEAYAPWNRARKEGVRLYDGWQEKKGAHRFSIFNSANDLVTTVNKNMKAYGGDGSWSNEDVCLKNKERSWVYGRDFPTKQSTDDAMSTGRMADKYISSVDKTIAELYVKFPMLHRLSEVAITKKRRRKFSEDDGELDIDRYMSSDPAMFSTMPRQDVRDKVAVVYVDIAANARTEPETLTRNMIMAVAMIDILERAGICTEVYVGCTCVGSSSDININNIVCKAKDAGEPLDISRLLTYALPGWFRHYMFCALDNLHDGVTDHGLGSAKSSLSYMGYVTDFFSPDLLVVGSDDIISNGTIQTLINKLSATFGIID